MPRRRRALRWPNGAEQYRQDIYSNAAHIRVALQDIHDLFEELDRYAIEGDMINYRITRAELKAALAHAKALTADIQRDATEARQGDDRDAIHEERPSRANG